HSDQNVGEIRSDKPEDEPFEPQGPQAVCIQPHELGCSMLIALVRCCACPETKSARDSCFLQHGADEGQCAEMVKKHVECMRGLGFEI
ncbi:COX17-domain-containing protein, partial [Butyriboletus roseoflavus]